MKVLHIAAGMASDDKPYRQPFIKSQIDSLIKEGINCGVFEIKSYNSKVEYIKSVPSIKSVVKKEAYELLHAHYSYCGYSALFASCGKPIVLSLMGSDLLGTPSFEGKQTFRGKIDKIITYFVSHKVNHIIVKSNKMKEMLNTKIHVSVIPNGVDSNSFKPLDINESRRVLGFKKDDFIVLFLGNRNQPVKNFNLAKASFDLFKTTIKNVAVLFVNPFGIDKQAVIQYMSASDVLLLTSFWEGSPNVVKEAMACNLPIVSTNVGDVKEIIRDTTNCFVVKFSPEEINEKLKFIYSNRSRSNGMEKIDHLKNDVIAKKILEVYKLVLNKN